VTESWSATVEDAVGALGVAGTEVTRIALEGDDEGELPPRVATTVKVYKVNADNP
jgi:hypothetical protein